MYVTLVVSNFPCDGSRVRMARAGHGGTRGGGDVSVIRRGYEEV